MEHEGQFLGRYQLVRVLGRGAMGVVYEGLDPQLNRQVAIKTILTSHMQDQALAHDYSARFIREAHAVARLNHPNIVTVFDFGSEAGVAYIVMEFIRGKELKSYLDSKHLFGIDETVGIVCELLEALEYAHANGIVHRDIKPANVMLDGAMRVKLTDFGVARLSDIAGMEGSRAGTLVGTPSYMSPEQIKGMPAGPGADLFAAGVLLYECLTLQKPFSGSSEWDIWQKIVNENPPLLAHHRANVPAALERALLRALAKNPADRYPSARAMIVELKAAVAGAALDADATRLLMPTRPAPTGDQAASLASSNTGTRAVNQTAAAQYPLDQGTNPRPQQSTAGQNHDIELEFWRSIKDSGDAEEFQLYLERFPAGTYSDLARRKIGKLAAGASGVRTDQSATDSSRWPTVAQRNDQDSEKLRLDEERKWAEQSPRAERETLHNASLAARQTAAMEAEKEAVRQAAREVERATQNLAFEAEAHAAYEQEQGGRVTPMAPATSKLSRLIGAAAASAVLIGGGVMMMPKKIAPAAPEIVAPAPLRFPAPAAAPVQPAMAANRGDQEDAAARAQKTATAERAALDRQEAKRLAAEKTKSDRIAASAEKPAPAPAAPPKDVYIPAKADFSTCAKPSWPVADLRNEHTGTVTISFLIDPSGRVSDSRVARSSGFDTLDTAAREAIALCQFTPGYRNGKAERAWMQMQYVWTLE